MLRIPRTAVLRLGLGKGVTREGCEAMEHLIELILRNAVKHGAAAVVLEWRRDDSELERVLSWIPSLPRVECELGGFELGDGEPEPEPTGPRPRMAAVLAMPDGSKLRDLSLPGVLWPALRTVLLELSGIDGREPSPVDGTLRLRLEDGRAPEDLAFVLSPVPGGERLTVRLPRP